jgi:hypothetical protein
MVPSVGNAGARGTPVLDADLYATTSTNGSPFAGSIAIANHGYTPAHISIAIDGYLFRDKSQMLDYIAGIPPMLEGEADYRKAWRFLTARGYFYTPYTGSDQQHDPLLFVNSLGYGYCDDFASVLATIWQWQGYESRVWWMTGHVVPEIRVGDRWMMFDADLGVFYTDRSGGVGSVEELSLDPQLIGEPIDPLYDSSYIAYEPLISDIYGSAEDNRAEPPVVGESRGMQIELPAGSEFIFPTEPGVNTFLFGEEALSHPLYYGAQLRVPSVAGDTVLCLPLFVLGISGVGEVDIDGKTYDIGSPELEERFAAFWIADSYTEAVNNLTLHAGASNVVIRMSLSAFVVDGPVKARVRISQQSGGTAHVTYTPSAAKVKAPEAGIISAADRRLDQAPYRYISPQLVFRDLGRELSR